MGGSGAIATTLSGKAASVGRAVREEVDESGEGVDVGVERGDGVGMVAGKMAAKTRGRGGSRSREGAEEGPSRSRKLKGRHVPVSQAIGENGDSGDAPPNDAIAIAESAETGRMGGKGGADVRRTGKGSKRRRRLGRDGREDGHESVSDKAIKGADAGRVADEAAPGAWCFSPHSTICCSVKVAKSPP